MRREYASSPFCHWRHRDPRIVPANPIKAVVAVTTTAPPSSANDDPRRAAAERVLGPGTGGSACDWIRCAAAAHAPLLSLSSFGPFMLASIHFLWNL